MPEPLPSSPLKLTVTFVLFQPLALAAGVRLALAVGAVLSMLMPETVVLAVLPALSVTVPSTGWSAPSPSVTGAVQAATPERASSQVKLTMTSALYQPLALAARSRGTGDGRSSIVDVDA